MTKNYSPLKTTIVAKSKMADLTNKTSGVVIERNDRASNDGVRTSTWHKPATVVSNVV